ncbi:P-loop containing nucleoside triphosphate hydrolase protein [Crassisporium funariophilum]|nr:P-loop containing nucleoside triphosphate hydrolase protein [Crassisporium funariophilum]
MRRNTALAVITNDTTSSNEIVYELDVSPRSSIESFYSTTSDNKLPPPPPQTSIAPPKISPSIRLLFSLVSGRHLLFIVIPAIFSSIIAGGIAPFMTYVIGQAFDAFARFPLTPIPPQSAKDELLWNVGIAALELIGLAAGSLALSSITSFLWIWNGETNTMLLRKHVYAAVTEKDMIWYDTHMGATEGSVQTVEEGKQQGPIGAGGLMAKFSRETDDVRMATSLASGMLIQYLTTCITCLLLAFLRSWQLTLVILSAVPLLMFIQGFSQAFAGPLLQHEREQTGIAATVIDRAVAAIATVKAFNAAPYEKAQAGEVFDSLKAAARKLNIVWGTTSAVAQFVMMGMFVQGFWFGAKLVREGKVSAGDVMAVFWACLIATSNLQMCIPQFITLAKGKFAMVSLLTLVGDSSPSPASQALAPKALHTSPTLTSGKSHKLRKITPSKCYGELALHNVTFAYPSRPTLPVLSDVSLFIPANETTFIVGSSGSGKTSIAQLLLRMYEPQHGTISLDEQDYRFLDENWMRSHIACVGQQGGAGVVILDEQSILENVAAGLVGHRDGKATKEEVFEACRAALMHEFVRDLPQGYDTLLGGGVGVGLSGGQKQRLAIARAKLRNPTVLILDEATSALDATSRILVFEALKRWRKDKTTIVITHDLSQIGSQDFVYVLKHGRVVEQGYRYDLEGAVSSSHSRDEGEFRKMMESQEETGGFLPEKDVAPTSAAPIIEEVLQKEDPVDEDLIPSHLKHQSIAIRPLTFGAWMFDVIGDLTGKPAASVSPIGALSPKSSVGRFLPLDKFTSLPHRERRPSSTYCPSPLTSPTAAHVMLSRRYSLPVAPTSNSPSGATSIRSTLFSDGDTDFLDEKSMMERSGVTARQGREANGPVIRTRWDGARDVALSSVKVEKSSTTLNQSFEAGQDEDMESPRFWSLMRAIYPTIPRKPLLFIGLITCILSGALTPIFSYLLSRLLFEVSIGAQNTSIINRFGGLVLGVAAIDGIFMGMKYFLMETSGMAWVTRIRNVAFSRVLSQDKKWFDRQENSSARLVQVLVRDGDDARNLISVVWGQFCVVGAMLGVGLIWALVRGWQLTLAGLAIAPVFALVMAVQSKLVAKCEVRNKRAREEVARGYYDTIINIRGIRCMSFGSIFKSKFDAAADKAHKTGVRGAFVEGCTYGVASGLIYLAEAILFYVGAVLIASGVYTYLQMVEVLNLVVFSVTIGSQLMAFTEKIAKATQAAHDFHTLSHLSLNTDESYGGRRPPLSGAIHLSHVHFAYPSRPSAPVLKDLTLEIASGECIAIVGPSGSGKSTIAALLQRLYHPTSGSITVGYNDLRSVDVGHLREHVGVVSQAPNLFDATIEENIRYGHPGISADDVRRAARAANVHEFVESLPQGYDTLVGENASLISGGQAQRLQIARALARPSTILILDECTSSLDPANQAAVIETIRAAKEGRTTVMITHNVQVMGMCDRIVVVDGGKVVEEGTYRELMGRRGVFATLASGGEWVGR